MGGLYGMLSSNQATYVSGETKIDVQGNARLVMDEITRQLRTVGYYPENFDSNTTNDINSTTNTIANPIQIATNAALAITGDFDGEGATTIVYFCLDGTTVRRRKDAGGTITSYTCASGDVLGENISSLRFSYFDSTGTALPNPPTSPYQLDSMPAGAVPTFSTMTQRNAVRRIVVSLTAQQAVARQGTQSYTLTSDVRLRNLN
jgi:Tfp pilus assembly protein PilW